MFNVNTDWNAVSKIAGAVAESCYGIGIVAQGMFICLMAMVAFTFVASTDMFRYVLASFTRDLENRHIVQDMIMEGMASRLKERINQFHTGIDTIIKGYEKLKTGIKTFFKTIALATAYTVWAVCLLCLALIFSPMIIMGMIGFGAILAFAKLSELVEARKEKATEVVVEDTEETEEKVEEVLVEKKFHWIQRFVAWLLAAHRHELAKEIAVQSNSTWEWVHDTYGSLHDLEKELDVRPPAFKDLSNDAAVALAMQALNESQMHVIIKAHKTEESIESPSTGKGRTKEILLKDLEFAWLENGVPEQYAVN